MREVADWDPTAVARFICFTPSQPHIKDWPRARFLLLLYKIAAARPHVGAFLRVVRTEETFGKAFGAHGW